MLHGNGVWRMIKNENEPFTLLRFILSDVAATPMNWSCDEKKTDGLRVERIILLPAVCSLGKEIQQMLFLW